MKYNVFYSLKKELTLIKENKLSYLYICYILYGIFAGIIPVVGAFYSKVIIDLIVKDDTSYNNIILTIAILIGICMICVVTQKLLYALFSSKAFTIRENEFFKLIELYHNVDYSNLEDATFEDDIETGMVALSGDGQGFQKVYMNILSLSSYFVSIILFCIIIIRFNVNIALLCLVSTIVTAIINQRVSKYQAKRQKEVSHTFRKDRYFSNVCSDFNYGKDIRVFSLKNFLMNKYNEASLSYLSILKAITKKEFKYSLFGLITLLLQDSLSYYFIIQAYFNNVITISEVSLYLSCIVAFSTVLREMTSELSNLIKNLRYSNKYFEVMDEKVKLTSSSGTLQRIDNNILLKIEFKNVSFKYPHTDKYILKDFNFTINPGEKLAIVGTNGAGKTTIVKLICGLFTPNEGNILINGIDSKEFNKEEYYKMFASVFQDFQIYAATIIENIIGNSNDVNERAKAIKCLEAVGLKDVIEKLPKGYDTPLLKVVDESGVDLSGGQRQKLAIARALYKDANMVILDEPTSALDALAETEIYQSFDNLVKNKTAVYISHRLSSTKFCDKIAFFNQDGLQEYGTHDELMNLHKEYYNMFITQGKYYKEEASYND